MSKIGELLKSYASYISIPWRQDAAPAQRVIFCVFDANDERSLLTRMGEFEMATIQAGHMWLNYDLDNSLAAWLTSQDYAEEYFASPDLLEMITHRYLEYITEDFMRFLARNMADVQTVVAITSVASLFDLLKVKEVIDKMAPHALGRLVVFFPGSYENNNYRLLDAYDGWNYLATPLMAGMD